jgi:hypothetical protein
MANIEDLTTNTRVMAPLGDVLHKGIIVEPSTDAPGGEGWVCVEFTPPVMTMKPYASIDHIDCPASNVILGWLPDQ